MQNNKMAAVRNFHITFSLTALDCWCWEYKICMKNIVSTLNYRWSRSIYYRSHSREWSENVFQQDI